MNIGEERSGELGRAPSPVVDYSTPFGNAHLAIEVPARPLGVLILGHGAGGDIDAPDLLAVRDAALAAGVAVVRVRQPYRVAGRRAPPPAVRLDVAFAAVLAGVQGAVGGGERLGLLAGLPMLVGGRSSGARVAARTARSAGAVGLLTLAFPLAPPGRPLVSRVDELAGAGVPTLAVQGARDAFGSAADLRTALDGSPARPDVQVVQIADADHSFRTRRADPTTTAQALGAVASAVGPWVVGWSNRWR
jgi:uncharacterized protein